MNRIIMKIKISLIVVVSILNLAATAAVMAQGCCGGGGSPSGGCGMGGIAGMSGGASGGHDHGAAQGSAANPSDATRPVLGQRAQLVFNNYLNIQKALAQDSVEGVPETATVMTQTIQGDSMKTLPPQVAQDVKALATVTDLEHARKAFKSLSDSLIRYLKAQKLPPGSYYEFYCPMVKASWVQTDKSIANPYLGQAMLRCGRIES
jgi:hypothetical protein